MELLQTIMEEIKAVLDQIKPAEMDAALDCLDRQKRLFVDGEGRSGLMAKGFAIRMMHLGYAVYVAGDTIMPALRQGDVFVAVSGSGSSANVISDAAKAKKTGCRLLVITSKPESPLAVLGDTVLRVPGTVKGDTGAGRGSIQLLSTLFDQCLHITLDALCLMVSRRDNVNNDSATSAHW